MGAHCYIQYNGEPKTSYSGEFRLFDNNYISFVTYDDKYLINEDSWESSESLYFYKISESDELCDEIKDPFLERISCTQKIDNCMYCENKNTCKKCNYGFSLVNGKCLSSLDYQNKLKYFTPENGTNYYTSSSKINDCEECYYDYYSFNNFHCTKFTNGVYLDETDVSTQACNEKAHCSS